MCLGSCKLVEEKNGQNTPSRKKFGPASPPEKKKKNTKVKVRMGSMYCRGGGTKSREFQSR